MKAALLLATVLVFASSTSAKYQFNCLISDKVLDVGNLDVFDAVWQHFYGSATEFGIISDKDYRTSNEVCIVPGRHQELTVKVNLEGRWGNEGEVGHRDMRNALLQAMWAFMQQVTAHTTYDIYTDCPMHQISPPAKGPPVGGHQITRAQTKEATCGRTSPNGDCPCPALPDFWPIECYGEKTSGYKVPSKVSIEVFDEDGKLMAEDLTVTFTATMDLPEDGGCGMIGRFADILASFVPVIGTYFKMGITVACGV